MLDTGPLAVPAVFAPHNPIMAAEGSKRALFDTESAYLALSY
jgi:hypothetical protein